RIELCSPADGLLLCAAVMGDLESLEAEVLAFEAETGKVHWSVRLEAGNDAPAQMIGFGNELVLISTSKRVLAIRLRDGHKLWEKWTSHTRVLAASGGAVLCHTGNPWSARLTLLDPFSGTELRVSAVNGYVKHLFPLGGDIGILSSDGEVMCFRGQDLSLLWRKQLPHLTEAALLPSGLWIYVKQPAPKGEQWFSVQPNGNLQTLAHLSRWKGRLLWAQGEYQLWEQETSQKLCRWQAPTEIWAWCKDVPSRSWLAQEFGGRVALASSSE
ncbi:MAG: PQQ-binding-like beta-propeller repeat protein, partial [Thermoanaerobaculum sp.]